MIILLLKASQPGLFDKLVPIKASVGADGTVRGAHTAIRHVRMPVAKPKPAAAPLPDDLFAYADAKPAPAAKPEPAKVDAAAPKEPEPKKVAPDRPKPDIQARLDRLAERRDPDPVEAPPAAPTMPGLDYSAGIPDVPAFGVPVGTSKAERRRLNARAAAMVNGRASLLEPEAEPVDLDVLRQYSGNGGCGDSLNEFYTEPKVAAAMWAALTQLGSVGPGATVLEPSCATGVFMATAPAGVRVTGVEIDPTSAKMAELLHPGHEVRNAPLETFATTDVRQFDAVIGNAPFGQRNGLIKVDKKDLSLHEAYFMDTALDKTKPGGVVAMIVNTTLMNARSMRKVRERLLRKGEFLGAIRMPNTAFEAANIDVTSDILFFRKRPDDVANALGVVDQDALKLLGAWDEEYLGGTYFEGRGADNVCGEVGTAMRQFGEIYAVTGSMVGVPEAIAEFQPHSESTGPSSVTQILAATKDEALKARIRGAAAKNPYDTSKRGDTKVVDGVTYVLEGEPLRWHSVEEFMAEKAVIDAGELGAEIERALQDDGYAAASGLADKVKAYVEAHGVPSKNPNLAIAAKRDKAIYRLIGAVKKDGALSELVTGAGHAPIASSFDAAAQTLALEVGDFTPSMVAGRWHEGTEEAILDHLYASPDYALDPVSGTWTSLDNYLTGDLWPKFDAAKAALAGGDLKPEDRAKLERQAAALEAEIDPKSLEDVEVMLNSGFIPLDVVAAFFNSKYEGSGSGYRPDPMSISYDEGYFSVVGGSYDSHLLRKYLNRDGVRKEDDKPTIDKWNEEFKPWLCASAYRDQVEEHYNRTFRGFRAKAYSEAPLDVPGLNADGLKAYQWSGLRWAMEAGKGIIAADVGLGKTVRALILAKLMRATGQAKKPMIIVPKSVAANWMRETQRWFPGSNVMVIGETYSVDKKTGKLRGVSDSAAERNRKFHDITQNDYDFILITQPAWNDLDLDPETKEKYVDEDFWEQRKKSLEGAKAKKTQKVRDSWDQKVARQDFERRTDAIYFNDLGVDAIIGDEMHAYKNLFAARDRFGQSPKFLGGSSSSKRAADMRYKTQWLRSQTGGKNVYGLTATPTKNSPLEVYSMLSHIAPEAFEKIGIRNSEEFLDRFCEFEDRNILTTTGQMDHALCVTGFKNLNELREIMRRYIDRKTAEDVGLELPGRDDRQHLVDMSAAQKEVYAELRVEAEAAKSKGDATGAAHPFSIMSRMDKATLDLELYDPVRFAGARSPKIDEAAGLVADGLKDGGQIIFCDFIESHDKIVAALVTKGVPRDQIGVMNAKVADTSAKRQNIAEAYRAGKLRVVIGNATMEEGVDGLQEGTTGIHHLNIPWTPATIQQRNGRGLRQGNTAEAIQLHNYLGKGTFDGYRYQTVSAKKNWMDLLWNGGDRVENLAFGGNLSHEEMLVALSENPDEARAKLAANKELAQAKMDAERHQSAAVDFASYRAMKSTFEKLKGEGRQKPSGQRLEHRLGRLRTALEADPYFKAKHALDATHDLLIQPQTGEAFEPGKAFEVGDAGQIAAGKYVVEKVHPTHGLVQVRRWGETGKDSKISLELAKLAHAVTPIEHDQATEDAHVAMATSAALAAGVSNLKDMKTLAAMPAAAIQANYAEIQKTVKSGMKAYKFSRDYGDIGLVDAAGKAKVVASYESANIPDDHDVMLPTLAHKRLAMDAYITDQAAAKITKETITGRRGAYTGNSRDVMSYPGGYGTKQNRWKSVLNSLWGAGAADEAHREFETAQVEAARHAPTFSEAIGHAAKAAVKDHYGSPIKSVWSRKALATLWAKAKREGKLGDVLRSQIPTVEEYGRTKPAVGEDMFSYRKFGDAQYSVADMPVRDALAKLAAEAGYHDMAAAMAISGADSPEQALAAVNGLQDTPHRADALRHLAAKHPHLAADIDLKETPVAA